jgi:hypothetical protein
MPFESLKFHPGLFSQVTPLVLETGWFLGQQYDSAVGFTPSSSLIRFPADAQGLPEVIGGWGQFTSVAGSPRGLHAWSTLPGAITAGTITPLLAIGTSSKLYAFDYTTAHDITPAGYVAGVASWAIDNFGQNLVAVRRLSGTTPGTTIYAWPPTNAYLPAAAISGAPLNCNGCVVSSPAQQLIAWGVNKDGAAAGWTGVQDPMLIAWTDYSDYTSWVPLATNAAGSFRLTQGSQIMTILPAQGQLLPLTDSALYSMQFEGGNLIYGFQQLGTGCGSIGPLAAATLGGQAFWWSSNGEFFSYDGVVRPLVCPIRQFCIDTVLPNSIAATAVSASTNSKYQEIRWDFPSNPSSTACDTYVSYNVLNGTWGYGTSISSPSVGRNAMTDFVPTLGYPIGVDDAGKVWKQETGAPFELALGSFPLALPWTLSSGFMDMSNGENFSFVDWLIADQIGASTSGQVTVYGSDYPTVNPPTAYGPYAFNPAVGNVNFRMRGRQIAFRFSNNGSTLPWRLGRTRIRVASDGRR